MGTLVTTRQPFRASARAANSYHKYWAQAVSNGFSLSQRIRLQCEFAAHAYDGGDADPDLAVRAETVIHRD